MCPDLTWHPASFPRIVVEFKEEYANPSFPAAICCNLRMQIEARDPTSGVLYYYNGSSGKSQWERPIETPALVSGECSGLPEYWHEVLDESTGMQCIITLLAVYLLHVICGWRKIRLEHSELLTHSNKFELE
ncbi:hypothetical protein HAX54_021271 [Datura stramonium]|uniref:WW domain-containing protein n=1 Tax=Datura stramonium TaxID=4076 RepID=A0ABS8S5E5_DATST|nr:hypothetical protein [Datura stramonium]